VVLHELSILPPLRIEFPEAPVTTLRRKVEAIALLANDLPRAAAGLALHISHLTEVREYHLSHHLKAGELRDKNVDVRIGDECT